LWQESHTPEHHTTTIRGLASEVVLDPESDPVPRRSAVNLDSLESFSVAVLVSRLGRLADARMHDICAALGGGLLRLTSGQARAP
jgi:mRNA-degrading endonuclease toxin of MazEF toxin-antitoxin module